MTKQNDKRKITLIHAFKNRQLQAFADELSLFSEQIQDLSVTFYDEEQTGRINDEVL